MTTMTSATGSPTPTPTPTSSAAKLSAGAATKQLLDSLGAGSGVDTTSLIDSLVTAQFDAKSSLLTQRSDALTAQISGVSTLKNAISTFATALETLTKGGTLVSQPVSGDTTVLTAISNGTGNLADLRANLTVTQLAAPQIAVSKTAFASKTATVGTGQLTLTFGRATYSTDGKSMTAFAAGADEPITINITDGSLDKIADAINAKKAGVTASVVTDADGRAFLSLKGETGKDQAFTLSARSTTGNLSRLAVGTGTSTATTMTSTALNARVTLDGVAVERASNTVTDLIDGAKLQLNAVSTKPVSLTSTVPTDALKNAVTDLVDTYNEVLKLVDEQTDPISGALKSDSAARNLKTSLQALTLKVLTAGGKGSPTTLASIGVRTTKEGPLEINAEMLTSALKTSPDAIEAMFADTSDGTGIAAALRSVSFNAGSTIYGLGASNLRYIRQQGDLSTQQGEITSQKEQMSTRLTQQFASMNSRVSAYKSTQTFLTNQIAAWNKSDN